MKKVFFSVLVMTICLFGFNLNAKALTTYEVETISEYFNAIDEISTQSNEEFIIKLNGDITIADADVVKHNNTIDNGNTVTIIGNGHTIKCTLFGNCRLNVSGATVNLGKEDKTDTLVLEGAGAGGGTEESLVTVTNGTVNMYEGVTLKNNRGDSGSVTGGAIRVNNDGTFIMHGGIVENNASMAAGYGGAIIVDYDTATFKMTGGVIKDNEAQQWGGAIYQSAGTVEITGGKFLNNSTVYGGAIAVTGGSLTVKNAIFEGNEGYYGGAILAYDYADATINVENTIFKNNEATSGGAIINYNMPDFPIKQSVFDGNVAISSGGAIYNNAGKLTSEENEFINNNGYYGGAIYSRAELVSDNDIIKNNTAKIGAGVYLKNNSASLATTDVYNNKAEESANDYYIAAAVTSITIKDAATINGYATFGTENVNIKNWFKDDATTRYTVENPTDVVNLASIVTGEEYFLTAAGNEIHIVTFNSHNDNDPFEQLVEVGSKVTKPTNPTKYGYKFINWYTEEELTNAFDFDAIITTNIDLHAKWEEIVYSFTKGNNEEYNKNDNKDLEFVINANYSLFNNKVYIDDELVDVSNYTSSNTNTTIVLKAEYLKTLAEGEHNIKVVFSDGGNALAKFKVINKEEEKQEEVKPDEKEKDKDVLPDSNVIPKTADDINLCIALLVIGIIGISLTIYLIKLAIKK